MKHVRLKRQYVTDACVCERERARARESICIFCLSVYLIYIYIYIYIYYHGVTYTHTYVDYAEAYRGTVSDLMCMLRYVIYSCIH
jgi:hypothetical protein